MIHKYENANIMAASTLLRVKSGAPQKLLFRRQAFRGKAFGGYTKRGRKENFWSAEILGRPGRKMKNGRF